MALIAFLILLAAPGMAGGDPLILRAQERARAGDGDSAARLYAQWLHLNPGSPGSVPVFASYFIVESDFASFLQFSREFLSVCTGVPGAAAQFLRIARMLDLAGRIEEARDAYLASFQEGGGELALISASVLSLEMNDPVQTIRLLEKLEGAAIEAGTFVSALAALRRGETTTARSVLEGIAAGSGSSELRLKSLWVLSQPTGADADPVSTEAARAQLSVAFPDAPETALAYGALPRDAAIPGSGVILSVTPLGVAPQSTSSPSVPHPAAPPASQQPAAAAVTYAVQAGAFQMKENADDLLGELFTKGFPASVIQESVGGRDRFRVLAGAGLDKAQAQVLLDRLAAIGYSGFVVTER